MDSDFSGRFKRNLAFIFFGSLGVMVAFAGFYQLLDQGSFLVLCQPSDSEVDLGFWEHFYFSVVTFIGLGYGDIVPASLAARCAAILEGLGGIVAFIFFIAVAARETVRSGRK